MYSIKKNTFEKDGNNNKRNTMKMQDTSPQPDGRFDLVRYREQKMIFIFHLEFESYTAFYVNVLYSKLGIRLMSGTGPRQNKLNTSYTIIYNKESLAQL